MTQQQQFDELIQAIDDLESRAAGYVTLPEVESRVGDASAAVEEHVLLVDHRTRLDVATGEFTPVTLCRLNRHHPRVQQLTGW
jgi:hypothetical protein